jgi:hypothetical protein
MGSNKLDLVEIEADIENFIAGLGVTPTKTTPVEEMLSHDPDELEEMNHLECEQNALVLTSYALDLQIKYNKLHSLIKWIDTSIDEMIIGVVNEYKAFTFEERRKLAVKDNSAASSLNAKKLDLVLRRDSMYGIINKLESMAKLYADYAKSKKFRR